MPEVKTMKDKVTNVVAVLAVVFAVGQTVILAVGGYLKSVTDVNWFNLGMAAVVAVIGYWTGKPNNA
jgi:hypothetical protein